MKGIRALLAAPLLAAGFTAVSFAAPAVSAHAADPCGSYPVTYNSWIYVTGDQSYPWYGANGNYPGFPITENQTPYGQPGYGWGPYQNFDICHLPGNEVLIYSTAIHAWVGQGGESWLGTSPFVFADSPGDEGWAYTCLSGATVGLRNIASGLNPETWPFDSGLFGLQDVTYGADAMLIHGLCGD